MTGDGVNFCVYAKRATGLDLLLFDGVDDVVPGRVIQPRSAHATGPATTGTSTCRGLEAGPALRVRRRTARGRPSEGLRFDPTQAAARPVRPRRRDARPATAGVGAGRPGRRRAPPMKSVVVDTGAYDWEGDRPLGRAVARDGHLRGAPARASPPTRARASRAERRGTYAGLHREDPVPRRPRDHRRRAAAGLRSSTAWPRRPAWSTTGATSRSRSSPRTPATPAGRAARPPSTSSATWSRRSTGPGIEVILDVVYNHTAEVGADGPTFCFRGLANDDYYLLDPTTGRATSTTAGPATRSTPTARSSAG